MSDQTPDLEARVAELTETVRGLERRLSALERDGAAPRVTKGRRAAAPAPAARQSGSDGATGTLALSLVGRTLLVLAGAFLLRALTDSGVLPAPLGVGLGFVYAGTWIALADRAAARREQWSVGFHGLSAAVIGFPLLFEATSRFKLLSSASASALLVVFTAVALGVTARRQLQVLGWLIALAGCMTAVALMFVTGRFAPPLLYLVLLAVTTLWLGYVRDWRSMRWPISLVADLCLIMLATRSVRPGAVEGPGTALFVLIVFIGLFLGSIAMRTLLLDRNVVTFEMVQTAAVMLVGLGGASYVASRSGMGAVSLGMVCVAFGIAAYSVAFAFVERRQDRVANFYFYTSIAILFVLAGTALVLSGAALPTAWAVLSLVVAYLARRQRRLTLAAHASVYAVAAAAASGLLSNAFEAVVSPAAVAWSPVVAASLPVLAAMACCAWLTGGVVAREGAGLRAARFIERIPRVALIAALATAAAGVAIGILVPALAGSPGAGANPGVVATIRTAVLVVGAVALAWLGRSDSWIEARWLVYPVLVTTGLKLLLEDISLSRPATLFVAFAAYGAALLVIPRLRRRAAAARVIAPPAS